MKSVLLYLGLFLYSMTALAQEKKDSILYFVGINPIAPFTGIPNQFTNLYLPLVSNLETGLALNFGIIKEKKFLESRISVGKPNSLFSLRQVHGGYNWHIYAKKSHLLHIGGFLKYYHLRNTETNIKNQSLVPYLVFGYRYRKNKFFYDLRLNQNLYAVSWSNLENTSLNSGFKFSVYDDVSPILPYLSFNVGYVFPRM